jgi:hypothetical protein
VLPFRNLLHDSVFSRPSNHPWLRLKYFAVEKIYFYSGSRVRVNLKFSLKW